MKLYLLIPLLIVSLVGLTTELDTSVLSQNKLEVAASPVRSKNRSLTGTWIGRITYQNCFLMGFELKLTESNNQVRVQSKFSPNQVWRRVGQRMEVRDKGQVMVLTISSDGNRISFPPQKDGRVITLHRAGSPGCRNLNNCLDESCPQMPRRS